MASPTCEKEKKPVIIREVWASNLNSEFALIQNLLPKYRHAAIDTEFPGFIFASKEKCHYSKLSPSYNYQIMKANVDALNIIQLGLTLSDFTGNLPDLGTDSCYIWQFNFKDFDIERDRCNPEAIQLLRQQGIDFARNRKEGISSKVFGKLFLCSGFLFSRFRVTWVTFHSGYDFGYLLKMLTATKLPSDLVGFNLMVNYFFGHSVFDMKHMMIFCPGLYGGLEKLSNTLKVDRVAGKCHQAGSDSLLTLQTFMKLRDTYFIGSNAKLDINLFRGVLYGLEVVPFTLVPLKAVPFPLVPFAALVRV